MSGSDTSSSDDEVEFALTPAEATNGVLNYATKQGRTIYGKATRSLYPEGQGYDCVPEGLYMFLQMLDMRAQEFGWASDIGILQIPEDPENIPANEAERAEHEEYFLDYYGNIELERI